MTFQTCSDIWKIPKKRNWIGKSSITCSHIWLVDIPKCVYIHSLKVWWSYVLPNTNAVNFYDIIFRHRAVFPSWNRKRVGNQKSNLFKKSNLSIRSSDPILVLENNLKVVYPKLYQVSRRLLSIIGTSVPSERLFLKYGNIVTDKKASLKREKILFYTQTDPS